MSSMITFYALLVVFVVLNVLDGHSTLKVISKTSYKNERNPIARFLFNLMGPVAGVIVLKSVLIPVIFLMFRIFTFEKIKMNFVLSVANVFYFIVVVHNYNVSKRVDYHRRLMAELDVDDE